jgi:hypothetical protein
MGRELDVDPSNRHGLRQLDLEVADAAATDRAAEARDRRFADPGATGQLGIAGVNGRLDIRQQDRGDALLRGAEARRALPDDGEDIAQDEIVAARPGHCRSSRVFRRGNSLRTRHRHPFLDLTSNLRRRPRLCKKPTRFSDRTFND